MTTSNLITGLNAHIAQYFTQSFVDAESLTRGELALVAAAAPKRQRDFATGRLCAKQALSYFGRQDVEILRNAEKAPVWPDCFVGSISHADGLCGALVAEKNEILAIGLDIEKIGGVTHEMWDMVCTPAEQLILAAVPFDEQCKWATLIFSIKESFYKLQHPITRQFLEFTDVELHFLGDQCHLQVTKAGYPLPISFKHIDITWLTAGSYVITVCYIPAN